MNENCKHLGIIIVSVLEGRSIPAVDYDWEKLISLFDNQDMIPYLYTISKNLEIDPEYSKRIKDRSLQLLSLHVNQIHEIDSLRMLFEKEHIDNLFFKGAVTCYRYPEPELRTMSDIDVLYKVDQHSRIKKTLLDNGYYGYEEGRKNDTFRKPKKIVLETHRQLVPSESRFFEWCDKAWERCELSEGFKHSYHMTIEDELIFNVIHFAVHFLEGGAGVRFLCDLYVYRNRDYDLEYVDRTLKSLELDEFYHTMVNVAEYWFSPDYSDQEIQLYDRIISFMMEGRVFGKAENADLLLSEGRGSTYLISHFFPSYKEMCSLYPWLNGKKILLPLAWAKRGWFTIVHKRGAVTRSINRARNSDKNKADEIYGFYRECGLSMKLRDSDS